MMWPFLLEGQFEIKHSERQNHDDGIGQNHCLVFACYTIYQPNRYIQQKNENHPK